MLELPDEERDRIEAEEEQRDLFKSLFSEEEGLDSRLELSGASYQRTSGPATL